MKKIKRLHVQSMLRDFELVVFKRPTLQCIVSIISVEILFLPPVTLLEFSIIYYIFSSKSMSLLRDHFRPMLRVLFPIMLLVERVYRHFPNGYFRGAGCFPNTAAKLAIFG